MTFDWQLAVVAVAVVAATAYVVWRARGVFFPEVASGSCEGCERGTSDENSPRVKPLVQLGQPTSPKHLPR